MRALALSILLAACTAAGEPDAAALFEAGWKLQEEKSDWQGALDAYEKAQGQLRSETALGARIAYEKGVCCARLGRDSDAGKAFASVWTDYRFDYDWCTRAWEANRELLKLPQQTDKELLYLLKSTPISLDFPDSLPIHVIEFIQEFARIRIRMEEGYFLSLTPDRLDLRLKDSTVHDALDLFARLTGTVFLVDGGFVVLTSESARGDRIRAVPADSLESTRTLEKRRDDARVSLSATSESCQALVEFLRMTTRLPIVVSLELRENFDVFRKDHDVKWKDTPLVEALQQLGLKSRVIDGVLLVSP